MLITNYMTPAPLTINIEASIAEAWELLRNSSFRHLPVTDDEGRLRGMVSDRDLRSAAPSTLLSETDQDNCFARLTTTAVWSIMSPIDAALTEEATLDDALYLFDREKIGALPVIDAAGKVTGILSIRDLIRAYNCLFGLGGKGSLLVEVALGDAPRPLSRLITALEEGGIPVSRIVQPAATVGGAAPQSQTCFVRVHTINRTLVFNTLEAAGFRVVR